MKILFPVGLLVVTLLFAACQGTPEARPTPTTIPAPATASPVPSATAVKTPTPTPTLVPTITPSPTPTLVPTVTPVRQVLRVDTLVCQRFFPGVPNPDGPNEWLHLNGSARNRGDSAIDNSNTPSGLVIELLTAEGAVVSTIAAEFRETSIAMDQLVRFAAPSVNAVHATAASCRVKIVSGSPLTGVYLDGKVTAEVTILAAP